MIVPCPPSRSGRGATSTRPPAATTFADVAATSSTSTKASQPVSVDSFGIATMAARGLPADVSTRRVTPGADGHRGHVEARESAIELAGPRGVACEQVDPDEIAGDERPVGRVAGFGVEHAEQRALAVAEKRMGAATREADRRDQHLAALRLDEARGASWIGHRHQRDPAGAALRRRCRADARAARRCCGSPLRISV